LDPLGYVLLVGLDMKVITRFETEQVEFPEYAIYQRDRFFRLGYVGDLGQPDGLPEDVRGAVYREVDPWRLSSKAILKLRSKRPPHTATVLPFVLPEVHSPDLSSGRTEGGCA
jgi:hypothetical protein